MAFNRCDACDGRKKVTGLGGMIKDCPVCNGVGFVAEPESVKRKRRSPAEIAADATKDE